MLLAVMQYLLGHCVKCRRWLTTGWGHAYCRRCWGNSTARRW